jgi:hypothetical protein
MDVHKAARRKSWRFAQAPEFMSVSWIVPEREACFYPRFEPPHHPFGGHK